ncbi:MAG: sulfate ABC transporter substrate-binding protein [Pseudanabaenaceae cyanobacterium]
MRLLRRCVWQVGVGLLALVVAIVPSLSQSQPVELTLVGYAVARPVFARLIPEFQREWREKTGQQVTFRESYGPSAAQTRAILAGLDADILAQNMQTFVTPLVERGMVRPDWQRRLPNSAIPAHSFMALMTRPGNPKNIRDWADLTRADVGIVAINPKTSGNARWAVVAGYGAVLKTRGRPQAEEFVMGMVRNIRRLVNSGREATDAFVKNRIGDVMINFENEVIFTNGQIPQDFPYIVPPVNVQVDFPVTVIDSVVDRKGTRRVAEEFTKFLFSPKAQEIYAQLGYRPINQAVFEKHKSQFQPVRQVYRVRDFGGWTLLDKDLFADGALFDRAQAAARRS